MAIAINFGELTTAMEDRSDEHSWYPDRKTGEIILRSDFDSDFGDDSDDDGDGQGADPADDEERFAPVETIASHEGFRIMEDFVAGLPQGECRPKLGEALQRRRPFAQFKDALCDFGPVREQWFAYHGRRLCEMARKWLDSLEIEYVEAPRPVVEQKLTAPSRKPQTPRAASPASSGLPAHGGQEVSIREYAPADLQSCRALWTELVERHRFIYDDPSIGSPDPAAGFDAFMANPSRRGAWVALCGDEVIGLTGLLVDGEEGAVEPVVVLERRRSQGIGRLLVDQASRKARELGLRFLSAKPVARNIEAFTFFVECGFDTVDRVELFCDLRPELGRQWRGGISVHGRSLRC